MPKGWMGRLARFGYLSKGVVYIVIGLLAGRIAVGGASGSKADASGAIREIGGQPFGKTLLALVALGLLSHVVWRLLQATLDPEGEGRDKGAFIKRLGYAVSGLAYAFLAFNAAGIALGWGSRGGSGGEEREWTARLLAMPFGPWLVGLVGAIVLGVGISHFYRAYKATFLKRYEKHEMSPDTLKWATRIGQFGLAARGVTFCMIGIFLIQAAIASDPNQSTGLSGALKTVAAQPFGPWLLLVMALGFAAFGVYCFSTARYRRFPTS